jgi:hypothetical protein
MTRKALALAFALLSVLAAALVGSSGPAQAAGGTYRITAGGDLDWTPDSGALDQTSSDKIEATGTLVGLPVHGTDGAADYHIASGPGVVRAKVHGSFTVPSNLAYPFNPSLQAVSTTELTINGPDTGFINTSVNVHVDGIIESPVCGGGPTCGAESIYVSVGPFTRQSEFNTLPDTRDNSLGLAFDPVPGGYRVHGDVTSATLGMEPNVPYPVTIVLNLSGRYNGTPTPTTIGGSFDDPAALYQVSFAPTGPVLNDLPAGYTVSGPNVTDNHWTDPFVSDVVVTNCADPALANLTSVAGNLVFRNIPGCPDIAVPKLTHVVGDVIIKGNTGIGHVTFSGPVVVDGSVRIVDNSGTNTDIDVHGISTSGDLDISGNDGTAAIDVGNGQIGGDLELAIGAEGDLDLTAIAVGGDELISSGGTGLLTTVTADGSTDITILGGIAALHAFVPDGAFDQPVGFTISRHTDPPQDGQAADGSDALIDPITGYQFAFDVPTLNADAQLSFTVDMSQLDAVEQADLLNAVASGLATIVGKGDEAGAEYRAFPVCTGSQTPAADGCAAIVFLDASGNPTTGQPAFVRFDGVVGHFSTYAVATVEPQLDTTPPVVTVPADVTIDATSPAGARASYSASATDDVDSSPKLACIPPSDSVLPIGTASVTCKATDAAGNSAGASFKIRVRGAGEQIAGLTDKTLAYLDQPALRPALKAALQAVADAIAAKHPKVACIALDLYVVAVKLAPAKAFTPAEKADLIADATRIKSVIGC